MHHYRWISLFSVILVTALSIATSSVISGAQAPGATAASGTATTAASPAPSRPVVAAGDTPLQVFDSCLGQDLVISGEPRVLLTRSGAGADERVAVQLERPQIKRSDDGSELAGDRLVTATLDARSTRDEGSVELTITVPTSARSAVSLTYVVTTTQDTAVATLAQVSGRCGR